MQKKLIRKYVVGVLLVCMCTLSVQENFTKNIWAAETTEQVITVQELDLGEYQSEMKVGEKQLLNVTVLPVDTTNQTITYASSDASVAQINGMGRITALKIGNTEISISCGSVVEKISLTVVDAETKLRDIDLGDYPTELEEGTSQLLAITMIPEEASVQEITYKSGNEKVASVNEIGRITAIKAGTTKIKVICGKIKKEFSLTVTEAKSDKIPATDIEIGDYEEELEVDKTVTLSATVLPSDATETKITYKSSNENIATVNSSGEVKGIAEGNVTITVSAGNIRKEVPLTVKVATSKIEVDTTYLVLQPGESHQLRAKAMPSEAGQAMTYETMAPEIASVTAHGLVTAKQCGSGTVVVKNEDTSTAVTVIVNAVSKAVEEKQGTKLQAIKTEYENEMYAKDYPVITTEMLKYFYENNENLTMHGLGYSIKINGEEIENWENELYTDIELKQEKQGSSFELNRSENMCGRVTIQFAQDVLHGKYVYLYNESKDKYELLTELDVDSMELDTAGKYLVTEKKLQNGYRGWIIFVLAMVVVVILSGVYVGVKKKYWFW